MAEIAVQPIMLKDMVIQIGSDDFAAAVSSATITPTSSLTTWKGLKPESVHTFPAAPTYALSLEYAQDWAAVTSLSRYLFDHDGETITGVVLEPTSGVGTRWTFNLVIIPGAVGGAVDTVATATVELGITGKPVPSAIVVVE